METGITNYKTPDWVYASVDEGAKGRVTLHSTAKPPPPRAAEKKTFLETLHSFPNQSLWKDMIVNGNGEWIHKDIQARSLILVHDGSYQEDLDPTRCLAAYIIMCKATGQQLQGTVVEKVTLRATTELSS